MKLTCNGLCWLALCSSIGALSFIPSTITREKNATDAERFRLGERVDSESSKLLVLAPMIKRAPRDVQLLNARLVIESAPETDNWIRELISSGPNEPEFTTDEISTKELEERYLDILVVDPLEDSSWHNLAWVYAAGNKPQSALFAIRRATQLIPDDPIYHMSYGLIAERYASPEAVREYALAIELSPRILSSQCYRDLVQRRPDVARGSLEEAIRELQRTIDDPVSEARLASILMYEGRDSIAKSLLDASLKKLPNLSVAWANVAVLNLKAGDLRAAQLDERRAAYLSGGRRVSVWSSSERNEISSPHYLRVRSEYREMPILRNDLLPTNLLAYCAYGAYGQG